MSKEGISEIIKLYRDNGMEIPESIDILAGANEFDSIHGTDKQNAIPIEQLGIDNLNKYKGYVNLDNINLLTEDINRKRALNQSGVQQGFNAIVGGVVSGALTAAENLSYLGDLTNITNWIAGKDTWQQNWLAKFALQGKQKLNRDVFPIYRESNKIIDVHDSGFWWEALRGTIDSAVGFAIPGGVVSRGAKLALEASKIAKFAEIIGGAEGLSRAEAIVSAPIMNYAEGKMMGAETYKNEMIRLKPLVESGEISYQEAKNLSSDAANKVLLYNRALMLANYIEVLGVNHTIKGLEQGILSERGIKNRFKSFGKSLIAPNADNLLLQAGKEGLEENVQNVIQSEGQYESNIKVGVQDKNAPKSLSERLLYFAKSDQAILEAGMGLFGGGPQRIVTELTAGRYSKANRKAYENRYNMQQAIISNNAELVKTILGNTNEKVKLKQDLIKKGKHDKAAVIDKAIAHDGAIRNLEAGTISNFEEIFKEEMDKITDPKQKASAEKTLEYIQNLKKKWARFSHKENVSEIVNLYGVIDIQESLKGEQDKDVVKLKSDLEEEVNKIIIPKYNRNNTDFEIHNNIDYDINNIDKNPYDKKEEPERYTKYNKFLEELKTNDLYDSLKEAKDKSKATEENILKLHKELARTKTKEAEKEYVDKVNKIVEANNKHEDSLKETNDYVSDNMTVGEKYRDNAGGVWTLAGIEGNSYIIKKADRTEKISPEELQKRFKNKDSKYTVVKNKDEVDEVNQEAINEEHKNVSQKESIDNKVEQEESKIGKIVKDKNGDEYTYLGKNENGRYEFKKGNIIYKFTKEQMYDKFSKENEAPFKVISQKQKEFENFKKSEKTKRERRQKELEDTFGKIPILSDSVGKRVKYKGKEYKLVKDPVEDVIQLEESGTNRVIDIPRDSELGNDAPITYYGITMIEQDVNPIADLIDIKSTDRKQIITIDGKSYLNLYSDPLQAINRDENGNIKSVTLSTAKDKRPRTFKKYAEELAYAILLETYNKLNDENQRNKEEFTKRVAKESDEQNSKRKERIASSRDKEESEKIESDLSEYEKVAKQKIKELEQFNENLRKALSSKSTKELESYVQELSNNEYLTQEVANKLNSLYNNLKNKELENKEPIDKKSENKDIIQPVEKVRIQKETSINALAWLSTKNENHKPKSKEDQHRQETIEDYIEKQGENLKGKTISVTIDTPNYENMSIDEIIRNGALKVVMLDENGKPIIVDGIAIETYIHLPHFGKSEEYKTSMEKYRRKIINTILSSKNKKIYGKMTDFIPGQVIRGDENINVSDAFEKEASEIKLVGRIKGGRLTEGKDENGNDKLINDIKGSINPDAEEGAVFAVIENNQGEKFPLRLQVSNLTENVAKLIVAIYTNYSKKNNIGFDTKLMEGDTSDVDNPMYKILEHIEKDENGLKAFLYIIAKNLGYKDYKELSLSEVVSSLVDEGEYTKNKKYPLYMKNGSIIFGNKTQKINSLISHPEELIDYLMHKKIRRIDFEYMNEPYYKNYIVHNNIIESNFKGFKQSLVLIDDTFRKTLKGAKNIKEQFEEVNTEAKTDNKNNKNNEQSLEDLAGELGKEFFMNEGDNAVGEIPSDMIDTNANDKDIPDDVSEIKGELGEALNDLIKNENNKKGEKKTTVKEKLKPKRSEVINDEHLDSIIGKLKEEFPGKDVNATDVKKLYEAMKEISSDNIELAKEETLNAIREELENC